MDAIIPQARSLARSEEDKNGKTHRRSRNKRYYSNVVQRICDKMTLIWGVAKVSYPRQGFRVKKGLSCVFSRVKKREKAHNLALLWLENPVFDIQRPAKRCASLTKQDPGRARQNS